RHRAGHAGRRLLRRPRARDAARRGGAARAAPAVRRGLRRAGAAPAAPRDRGAAPDGGLLHDDRPAARIHRRRPGPAGGRRRGRLPPVTPRPRFIVANRLRHHLLEWSERGPALLLLHGFLEHAHTWDLVAPQLAAAGHHVFALDWRGHGDSEWVGSGGYY